MKRIAGDQLVGGINRLLFLLVAPHAQRIEILQGDSERVHARMARCAEGRFAMGGEQLSQGRLAAGEFLGRFLEVRYSRGRWRGGRSQDVLQDEQAALYRR